MKKKAKNKFEKIRRINDLTQTEESKIIGVSPHHISEFENALKDNKQNMPMSLSLIVKISTLYNIPIDYFFSDESRRFKIQCLYSFMWLADNNTEIKRIKLSNQFYFNKYKTLDEGFSPPVMKRIPQIESYEDNSRFLNNLKFYRMKRKMSQVELSIKMSEIMKANSNCTEESAAKFRANPNNISSESIKKIEGNNRNMTIFHAKAASELFNIPLFFLVQTDIEIDYSHYLRFCDSLSDFTDSDIDSQLRYYDAPNEEPIIFKYENEEENEVK